MRKDQKNRYVRSGGVNCPYCRLPVLDGRVSVVGGSVSATGVPERHADTPTGPALGPGEEYLRWRCRKCNMAWDEVQETTGDLPNCGKIKEVRSVHEETT